MVKYECPQCKALNEEEDWNESTRKYYNDDIYELNEFPQCADCDFICPACGSEIFREYIKEVLQ